MRLRIKRRRSQKRLRSRRVCVPAMALVVDLQEKEDETLGFASSPAISFPLVFKLHL
jgi:hypothetical protein